MKSVCDALIGLDKSGIQIHSEDIEHCRQNEITNCVKSMGDFYNARDMVIQKLYQIFDTKIIKSALGNKFCKYFTNWAAHFTPSIQNNYTLTPKSYLDANIPVIIAAFFEHVPLDRDVVEIDQDTKQQKTNIDRILDTLVKMFYLWI